MKPTRQRSTMSNLKSLRSSGSSTRPSPDKRKINDKKVGLFIPESYTLEQRRKMYKNTKNKLIMKEVIAKASRKHRETEERSPTPLDEDVNSSYIPEMYGYLDDDLLDQFEEDDDDYDEEMNMRHFHKKHEKEDRAKNIKTLFALLMIPSMIVVFNSHKKMNKEENNFDVSAMTGLGGRGMAGIPGMGGGAAGMARMGGAAGMAGMGGRHHPMADDDLGHDMDEGSPRRSSFPGSRAAVPAKKRHKRKGKLPLHSGLPDNVLDDYRKFLSPTSEYQ